MRLHVRSLIVAVAVAVLLPAFGTMGSADEAPIAGMVKDVDAASGTLLVESRTKGTVRDVTIHVRPESKIVRFVRSADASKPGFSEQPVALADLRPGSTVSVKTRHEGEKEVAEVVRVVHEK